MEFVSPDLVYTVRETSGVKYDLFGHGGTKFWMFSSVLLAGIYLTVLLLPLIPFAKRTLALPNKTSFYQYCGVLLMLYIIQAVGTGLIEFNANASGLCLVNMTTYLYLAFLTPIVYFTFLSPFFKTTQPTLLFSYKAQVKSLLFRFSPASTKHSLLLLFIIDKRFVLALFRWTTLKATRSPTAVQCNFL